MVHVVFSIFVRKNKIVPRASIPSTGYYLHLIGQNYFLWPHRESAKVSLEFFQAPELLAGRGWEYLMTFQGSMPAIIGQINDTGGGEIRD